MKIEITVKGEQSPFVSDIKGFEKLIIGRFDPDTGESPAIDLGPYKGLEQGVSRRHAAISARQNTVHIVDLESQNGTYVNEVRLYPSQPHRLRHGDMIRVGFLNLTIHMEHMPQTESFN